MSGIEVYKQLKFLLDDTHLSTEPPSDYMSEIPKLIQALTLQRTPNKDIKIYASLRDAVPDYLNAVAVPNISARVTLLLNALTERFAHVGLVLNQHTFKRLTGPIAYSVLKPKPFVLPNGNTYVMPVILGLGDAHGTMANQCSECKADCASIYDASFMDVLDAFGSSHETAFYLEFPFDFLHQRSEDIKANRKQSRELLLRALPENPIDIIDKIEEYTFPCFFHEYADEEFYKQGCPVKHVKFHLADVRNFNYVSINGIKYWFETIIRYIISLGLVHLRKDIVSVLKQFCESQHVNFDELLTDIEAVLVGLADGDSNIFANFIFGKYARVSRINHQLRDSEFKELWKTWFPIAFRIGITSTPSERDHFKASVRNVFADMRSDKPIQPDAMTNTDRYTFVNLFAPTLDVYVIARITKRMHSDDLTVLYLGQYHIDRTSELLTQIGLADIVHRSESKPIFTGNVVDDNRCIVFDQHIDLDALVAERQKLLPALPKIEELPLPQPVLPDLKISRAPGIPPVIKSLLDEREASFMKSYLQRHPRVKTNRDWKQQCERKFGDYMVDLESKGDFDTWARYYMYMDLMFQQRAPVFELTEGTKVPRQVHDGDIIAVMQDTLQLDIYVFTKPAVAPLDDCIPEPFYILSGTGVNYYRDELPRDRVPFNAASLKLRLKTINKTVMNSQALYFVGFYHQNVLYCIIVPEGQDLTVFKETVYLRRLRQRDREIASWLQKELYPDQGPKCQDCIFFLDVNKTQLLQDELVHDQE